MNTDWPMKTAPKTLILSLSLIAPLIANAADWPQYRGNGAGIAAEPIAWKPAGLSEVWKQASPGGFSSFTIAEGRAFTHELKDVDGAMQEALERLSSRAMGELELHLAQSQSGANRVDIHRRLHAVARGEWRHRTQRVEG